MADAAGPIKITTSDLTSQRVEEFVAQQQAGRQGVGVGALPPPTPFWLSPIFYLGLAGALGGLAAWALLEPYINESMFARGQRPSASEFRSLMIALLLLFPSVGGGVGLFVGAAEGVVSRNLIKGLLGGSIGLAVGFVGAAVSLFVGGTVFSIFSGIAQSIQGPSIGDGARVMAFVVLTTGRSIAWATAACTAGLGQGIAMRSGKMVWTGILGGMMGGALGGLLFDPLDRLLVGPHEDAALSRAVGVICVGLMAGVFIGLVEHFAKEAWLLMVAGPPAGKQFVMYKNPTTLGSSPKCDVYLFKDPEIEPRHAQIHKVGVHYEIEDCGSAAGVYVNNIPIKRQRLQDGDRIVLGQTAFQYSERAKEKTGA